MNICIDIQMSGQRRRLQPRFFIDHQTDDDLGGP
jgi:hypothetical protein